MVFGFVFNICSTIVFYFKLFKRRLFTVIGLGHQPKSQDTSILPQRQNPSSLSSHGLQVEESWDSWTQDAKHELTSVSIGNQETFIEDRKIDNLFAEMAPQVQHHANVVPIKPRLEMLQSTSSFNSVSKFAFNDAFTTKPELDEWQDGNDNAWDQEDLDDQDIAAVEKRKLHQERKERRMRDAKPRDTTKEVRKLGTRA